MYLSPRYKARKRLILEERIFTKAFLTLLIAVSLLAVYPILYDSIPFFKTHFRSYTLWGKGEQLASTIPQAAIDTTVLLSASDSMDLVKPIVEDTIAIPPPTIFDNAANLQSFFKQLAKGKEQVRIAYFGDSSIEGDLISQTVRDSLQRRFGGAGVGYVPIYSGVAGFRRSISHKMGGEWEAMSFGKKNPYAIERNIAGAFFLARQSKPALDTISTIEAVTVPEEDEGHWVQYAGVNLFPGLKNFPKARLLYGRPVQDSLLANSNVQPFVTVSVGESKERFALDKRQHLNQQWLTAAPCRKIRLDFDIPENLPLYGVSLESETGIVLDNFAARGNSGVLLAGISGGMLVQFDSLMQYDLIILQYGLNVINAEMEDYNWYRSEMRRMIRHLKRHLPKAAILLVGPTDKAIKIDSEMLTDPGTPWVNETLRLVASQEHVSFFSFYDAMGGEGSMIAWVEEKDPPWANLDYTHFNFRGAHQAGKLLLSFLMGAYDDYINTPNNEQ